MAGQADRRNSTARNYRLRTLPLLVALIILFIFLVGYGWERAVSVTVQNPIASMAIATMLLTIAILSAKVIGLLYAEESDEDAPAINRILLPLALTALILISAFGTTNGAFYLFEGSSVLRNDIEASQVALQKLDNAAVEIFDGRGEETRRRRLNELLEVLEPEIVNNNGGDFCGIGPEALGIISRIKEILPQFRVPSGATGRYRCSTIDADRIYDSLEQQANRLFAASLNRSLADARADIKTAQTRLDAANDNLAALSAADVDDGAFLSARRALKDAASTYSRVRQRIAADASDDNVGKLPEATQLDIRKSMNLGSFFQLPETLVARWNYLSTWFYLFVALALDFLLVALFRRDALSGGARPKSKPRMSDPLFLWIPPAGDNASG